MKQGSVVSEAKNDKAESVYENYYDFSEPLAKTANHRILALDRGEKEGFITVSVSSADETPLAMCVNKYQKNQSRCGELAAAAAAAEAAAAKAAAEKAAPAKKTVAKAVKAEAPKAAAKPVAAKKATAKAAPARAAKKVAVVFEVNCPLATTVSVAGSFNNWMVDVDMLKKDKKSGLWKIKLELLLFSRPGRRAEMEVVVGFREAVAVRVATPIRQVVILPDKCAKRQRLNRIEVEPDARLNDHPVVLDRIAPDIGGEKVDVSALEGSPEDLRELTCLHPSPCPSHPSGQRPWPSESRSRRQTTSLHTARRPRRR